MPYYLYRITLDHRPSLIETFEKFQDARARVRSLRAELPADGGVTVRMIFAEDTRKAQILLTDARSARTDGDD